MTISKAVQEEIIASLMKNSYLYSICKDEMTDGYFSDGACKTIYKALSIYYSKYNSIPGLNELLIMIDDCYFPTVGVGINEVKDACCRLFEYPEPDEVFIKDKITDFLRKVRSSSALKDFVDKLKTNPNLESDNIVNDLAKALDVQLSTTRVFMMSDADQAKEARAASIGSEDQSKIIHSFIPSLNNVLMFGGYQPSTVNMICSPPGCFTGDTRIMTLDGKSKSLEEMYKGKESPEVYGCDKDLNFKVGSSDSVYLSDYVEDLVEVEVDNKYKIKCTPDHPFMMRDGTYKRADQLSEYDSLMPIRREYRLANKAGSKLCKPSEGYECIVNGNNDFWYTHRLSAERLPRLEETTHVHHKDLDRLNNRKDNLVWMTPQDHQSFHYWNTFNCNEKFREGSIKNRISKGEHRSPKTEITTEQVRERNLVNWKSKEYREFMHPISVRNGKESYMVNHLNYTKEFQIKTQRGKVYNFINRLLTEFSLTDLSEKDYEKYVERSSAKRKVWLEGIRKYFDEPFSDIVETAKSYNHKVTKVTKIHLNEKVPVYGIVDAKPFGNYAIALSDTEGIFVSNTGKSMFLINEGVNAAKQGFDILHIFIGDMVEYDGFIRYLSCVSGTSQNTLVMMNNEKQQDVVKICNQQYDNIFDHIFILAYPSLSLGVDTLIEDINKFEKQLGKDFGMIIIDYPDNLIQDGRSLYEDGGTLYSSLERLARLSKSVILTASQPQKYYWQHEIIPLEAAAESSKKQQCVDIMLTFNTVLRGANVGSILLAKARKGNVGKLIRVSTDFAKCKIEEINEGTYNAMKAAEGIK